MGLLDFVSMGAGARFSVGDGTIGKSILKYSYCYCVCRTVEAMLHELSLDHVTGHKPHGSSRLPSLISELFDQGDMNEYQMHNSLTLQGH